MAVGDKDSSLEPKSIIRDWFRWRSIIRWPWLKIRLWGNKAEVVS